MTDKQPEALRLAAWLKEGAWHQMRLGDVEAAGRELVRQHAEIERKDALLKRALEALQDSADYVREDYRTNWRHGVPTRQAQLDNLKAQVDEHEAAMDAITKELQ